MSREALEMEHLFLYRGSARLGYREGSYAEDSETHVIDGSGSRTFIFIGAP
jgi:hypothetical protein